jgi:uncharacterized protein involved in exopolysaccharide biosynthesis
VINAKSRLEWLRERANREPLAAIGSEDQAAFLRAIDSLDDAIAQMQVRLGPNHPTMQGLQKRLALYRGKLAATTQPATDPTEQK